MCGVLARRRPSGVGLPRCWGSKRFLPPTSSQPGCQLIPASPPVPIRTPDPSLRTTPEGVIKRATAVSVLVVESAWRMGSAILPPRERKRGFFHEEVVTYAAKPLPYQWR